MEPDSDFKILKGARLIDGNGSPSLNNQAVLIKDSEIVTVGDTQDIKPPDGSSVEVLDFGDKTIITDTYGMDFDELMETLGLAPFERGNRVRVFSTDWLYE